MADLLHYYLTLQPPQIPSQYLYDALGSSLFEAICELPWYRITRAELRLLGAHAPAIGATLGPEARVVELGCGSGEKLAALLAACPADVEVRLIDVSARALERTVQVVRARRALEATAHRATYEQGLMELPAWPYGRTLVAFLGSNIGNFDPPGAAAFLRVLRSALRRGDELLLGADLVKPERELRLAYDDPLGVTAAFNKNLLLRLNAELDADFDLDAFAHRAVWSAHASRVEMHLVSRRDQQVHVRGADLRLSLAAGDAIWTESSYKYRPREVRRLVEPSGFRCRRQWIDRDDGFALTLFEAC
jgi:dimethylhistidine N-methyltransferase